MTNRTTNTRKRMTFITAFANRIKTNRTTFARITITYWTTFARTF